MEVPHALPRATRATTFAHGSQLRCLVTCFQFQDTASGDWLISPARGEIAPVARLQQLNLACGELSWRSMPSPSGSRVHRSYKGEGELAIASVYFLAVTCGMRRPLSPSPLWGA